MGRSLIRQRAGKGSPTFRSPSHLRVGSAKYPPLDGSATRKARVVELVHDPGRYVPLARVVMDTGEEFLMPAVEGMYEGQVIEVGPGASISPGNVTMLKNIPEGTLVCNVELRPGDGGRIARQAGSYCVVLGKSGNDVVLLLPSGKQKTLSGDCRATIGIPAGAGRIEKPLMKAGNAYHKWKRKARKWPRVRGVAMIAACHPFGGGRHQRKSKPSTVSRNA
ncbi:MAG: 50S ribosomal protein L2, partial [Acidilobaceae archaeon]